jgi:uncharacterized protein
MTDVLHLATWEARFRAFLESTGALGGDAAHDHVHVLRVVGTAKALAAAEGADLRVVVPAAWLHDCVHVPKHSPDRARASRLAADAAGAYLRGAGYPAELVPAVEHAIHAHSFSANVEPRTIEAAVVQDADRLDALGAVGIARTLMLGGAMGAPLYDATEPIPVTREPDDRRSVVDHFFTKLLHLEARMRTASGRAEAARRTAFMRAYLAELEREIEGRDTAV